MEEEKQENKASRLNGLKLWLVEHKRLFIATGITIGVLVVVIGGGLTANTFYYSDRIFNGVSIGYLDLSGLTKSQAKQVLNEWNDDWQAGKMKFVAINEQDEEIKVIDFYPNEEDQYIKFDIEVMVEEAYQHGRDSFYLQNLLNQVGLLIRPASFQAIVDIDEEQLKEVLASHFSEYETQPMDATLRLIEADEIPDIVDGEDGNIFDYEDAVIQAGENLHQLNKNLISVYRSVSPAKVSKAHAQAALDGFEEFKDIFPLKLVYNDELVDLERKWTLDWEDAYQSVQIEIIDEVPHLVLIEEALDDFWKSIELLINIESKDAVFEVGEDEKVTKFEPSQDAYQLNREQSLMAINHWLMNAPVFDVDEEEAEEPKVSLVVDIIPPEVTTASVNDLGIKEILGVGYSNYSGSPPNRVHNIANGARKLNGTLVAPDEEFSLLSVLRPFTSAGGYLSELVIKGDEIIPEIGGGLCQIGTTTFRATMKSALNITQRSNHSLVVSYYNDHRNGNPGTDATIYDPSPDFRFINDTGYHVLIQTAMNYNTGELFFTFWGTNDGRKGEYSQPVVHGWVGAGETKYVDSEDLEPGVEKCQGAHPGASASFTYTITRPNGEVEEKVYSSSYRALPRICLVGIDPNAPKEEGEADVGGEDSEEVVTEEDYLGDLDITGGEEDPPIDPQLENNPE